MKNVLSDKHIHNFKKYKKTLKELGYKNYFKVINAKHWGIPQNRERIFVVSIRKDIDNGFYFPISSLEGQQSLFNQNVIDIEPKILKDVLETNVDEKYYIDNDKVKELLKELTAKEIGINPCIAPNRLDNHQARPGILEVCEQRTDEGLRFFKDNICGSLRTIDSCGDKRVVEMNKIGGFKDGEFELNPSGEYPQGNRVYSVNGLACTQSAIGGGGGAKTGLYIIDYRIRKLIPLECWRLMGFNDKDYFKARQALEDKYYNGQDRSDSQCYKMAGNSIVVNVLEYIFKELFKDRLKIKGVD